MPNANETKKESTQQQTPQQQQQQQRPQQQQQQQTSQQQQQRPQQPQRQRSISQITTGTTAGGYLGNQYQYQYQYPQLQQQQQQYQQHHNTPTHTHTHIHNHNHTTTSSSGGVSSPKHRKSRTQEAVTVAVERPSTRWFRVMTTLHSYPLEGPHYLFNTNEEWYCDNTKCKHTIYGKYAKYPLACWRSVELGTGYVLCDPCVKLYSAARHARISSPNTKPVQVNITLEVNPNKKDNHGHPSVTPHVTGVLYDNGVPINTISPAVNVVTTYVNNEYQEEGKQTDIKGGEIQEEKKNVEIPKETPKEISKEKPKEVPKEMTKNMPKDKEARILKQGWLLKQGEVMKTWKQRYFMLQSDAVLYYYQDDKSHYPIGSINLKTCRKIRCGSNMDFDLVTDERIWKFVAKKSETRDDWVANICELSGCAVENDANPFESIKKQ